MRPSPALHLERLLSVSAELFCVAGFDGWFKWVNPAFERTLGYSADELTARPYLEFVHPDDRELPLGDAIGRFQNRYVCKDGSVRWLQWSVRPVPAEAVIYGAARDITDARQLAAEQAALRRVATLVARGGSSGDVFASTAAELHAVVAADATSLIRYERDGTATMLAAVGESGLEVGARLPLDGDNVSALVRRNGRAVRVDDYARVAGRVAARLRASDLRSGIGAPILVDGVLWGAMATSWSSCPPPAGVESRVAQFTELVATAIANAASRAALIASRARIVATADDTRRRIERDLHDGAQQRLVALQLELRAAEAGLPESLSELRAQLAAITERMTAVVDEVQEISRGIHPAILSTGGLGPALRTLTGLAAVPVELEVDLGGPLPSAVEVAAYYVVSEALTNAAKHARASVVLVEVRSGDAAIEVRIRDDGDGGADPAGGSGLVGLRDRVEALGGVLGIVSPRGGGTRIAVTIPIA